MKIKVNEFQEPKETVLDLQEYLQFPKQNLGHVRFFSRLHETMGCAFSPGALPSSSRPPGCGPPHAMISTVVAHLG